MKTVDYNKAMKNVLEMAGMKDKIEVNEATIHPLSCALGMVILEGLSIVSKQIEELHTDIKFPTY